MRPSDSSLNLDNVLFVLAIAATGGFAIDRFFEDEHEKTAIAQASQLRKSALAQASESCKMQLTAGDEPHEGDSCELRKELE